MWLPATLTSLMAMYNAKLLSSSLNKLRQSPELGIALGHKMGVDLSGYLALHFYKNQYRIVYKVLEDQKEVEVWGIAEREAGAVYKMVSKRVEQEQ